VDLTIEPRTYQLVVDEDTVSFHVYEGSTEIDTSILVYEADYNSVAFEGLCLSGDWCTSTPVSGTTPASVALSVNPTGMSPGMYYDEVVFNGDSLVTPCSVVVVLTVAPKIIPPDPDTCEANDPCNVVVQTSSSPDTALLFYRPGGSSEFASTEMDVGGTTCTGAIPYSARGIRGIEWYVRVVSSGVPSTLPAVVSDTTPYNWLTVALTDVVSPQIIDNKYNMIGVPFDVSPDSAIDVFGDDFGTYNKKEERLGRLNPETQEYDEYPYLDNVVRGAGFWLILRDGGDFDASGWSAVPDTLIGGTQYGTLALAPAWNQISTPFAFDIDWDSCWVSEGQLDPLVGYSVDSNGYVTSSLMEPFVGYFVYNYSADPAFLFMPCVEADPGATVANRLGIGTDDGWSLSFTVSAGKAADLINVVGASTNATDGLDHQDFMEPPPFGESVSLSSIIADKDGGRYSLAGDIRSGDQEHWVFDLLLQNTTNQTAYISVDDFSAVPSDLEFILCNVATGLTQDLRAESKLSYAYRSNPRGTNLKLIVAKSLTGEVVDSVLSSMRPETFTLDQNYPNPFNPTTTIRYDVQAQCHVMIDVYNLLGQHVRSLMDGMQSPGCYEIQWDGTDFAGKNVATGLYFYRFKAGDHIESKKMLLVK